MQCLAIKTPLKILFLSFSVFLFFPTTSTKLNMLSAKVLSVSYLLGGLAAQWVKRGPTDPMVQGSCPTRREIFSTLNGVPLHTSFHYHLPIILIWLKHCWKGHKIASHPAILIYFRTDPESVTEHSVFHQAHMWWSVIQFPFQHLTSMTI